MATSKEEALSNCLASIQQGAELEDCTAPYSEYKGELEELLTLAAELNDLKGVKPRQEFAQNAGERLAAKLPDRFDSSQARTRPVKRRGLVKPALRAVLNPFMPERMPAQVDSYRERVKSSQRGRRVIPTPRGKFSPFLAAVVVVLLLSIALGGTARAADRAAPGDLLYSVDLTIERILLDLISNPADAASLRLKIAEERLAEAEIRLKAGDVRFGNMALEAYENQIAELAHMVGGQGGADRDQLAALLDAALAKHLEVLAGLVDKLPEQAQFGISQAMAASSKVKNGRAHQGTEVDPQGPPEGLNAGNGKPEGNPSEEKKNDNAKDKKKEKTQGKPDSPPGKP
jgi:hypothetical protein